MKNSGYVNYSLRGSALVGSYTPGPQRTVNTLGDSSALMGSVSFKHTTDYFDNAKGPASLGSAQPDMTRFGRLATVSAQDRIGMSRPAVNKVVDYFQRGTEPAQVSQLKLNPLSMFTRNPEGQAPVFFQDSRTHGSDWGSSGGARGLRGSLAGPETKNQSLPRARNYTF